MLKIRYFRLDVPQKISGFVDAICKQKNNSTIKITQFSKDDVVFTYASSRLIQIRKIAEDGLEVIEEIPTIDLYSLRIFKTKKQQYLSINDPPRGGRLVSDLMTQLLGDVQYFIEPLELTPALIRKHANMFDSSQLVSAKVRDFEVYDGAIGRLEISSKNGLMPSIAPFLENKFHRVDALTYEVSQRFTQGLIYYYRNGSLKVSGPLADVAFPAFESCFD